MKKIFAIVAVMTIALIGCGDKDAVTGSTVGDNTQPVIDITETDNTAVSEETEKEVTVNPAFIDVTVNEDADLDKPKEIERDNPGVLLPDGTVDYGEPATPVITDETNKPLVPPND